MLHFCTKSTIKIVVVVVFVVVVVVVVVSGGYPVSTF